MGWLVCNVGQRVRSFLSDDVGIEISGGGRFLKDGGSGRFIR